MSPAPIKTADGSAEGPAVGLELGDAVGESPESTGPADVPGPVEGVDHSVADAAWLGGSLELTDSVALGTVDHPQAATEAATATAASSRRICSGLITPDPPG
jgi:hypothetical protein